MTLWSTWRVFKKAYNVQLHKTAKWEKKNNTNRSHFINVCLRVYIRFQRLFSSLIIFLCRAFHAMLEIFFVGSVSITFMLFFTQSRIVLREKSSFSRIFLFQFSFCSCSDANFLLTLQRIKIFYTTRNFSLRLIKENHVIESSTTINVKWSLFIDRVVWVRRIITINYFLWFSLSI